MKFVNLGDICHVKKGTTITKKDVFFGNIPVIAGGKSPSCFHSISNRSGNVITVSASGANAGYLNYFLDPIFASDCTTIQSKDESIILTKFVYKYLVSIQELIYDFQRGAAQPHVYGSDLEGIQIPLPPLEEQKAIVIKLDKLIELIDLKKEAIGKTEQLTKSVFLEMFGDPKSNPKKWIMGTIRELLLSAKYGTSKKANEENLGLKVLRMNNITYGGGLDFVDMKNTELEENELEKYTVKKGDILFNRTNSKELVGKTAIYDLDEPMIFAGYLVRLRVNPKITVPEFISNYLNSKYGKAILFGMAKNIVGMANINAQEVQNIKIYIPVLSLQQKFAVIVHKNQLLIKDQKYALKKLQELYDTTTQEIFSF